MSRSWNATWNIPGRNWPSSSIRRIGCWWSVNTAVPPFSRKALGVNIRERFQTLRIDYRTFYQIYTQADRLLGPELSDVD